MASPESFVWVSSLTGLDSRTWHSKSKCVFINRKNHQGTPVEVVLRDLKNAKPCSYCTKEAKINHHTPNIASTTFPLKIMIPVWSCSDGQEFGTETDALRHELDLNRNRRR